jgi:GNAT superfamily N-acetyltransferase
MEPEKILELYDQQNRIGMENANIRREVTPEVVRHLSLHADQAWVMYSWLNEQNLDRVIEEQIAYFAGTGRNIEWEVYSYDWPPDLKDRLAARGFEIGEAAAFCVLDLEEIAADLLAPPVHDVREISTVEGLDDFISVHEQVWEDEDFSGLKAEVESELWRESDQQKIYVAYADGIPVSAARINFVPGSSFADLFGGSTLPEYRGRGFYHELVAVRAQAARQRGIRFLSVYASPMSRPILEKLGFKVLAFTYPCRWTYKDNQSKKG